MKLDNDSIEINWKHAPWAVGTLTTIGSNLIGALAVFRAAPEYWVVFHSRADERPSPGLNLKAGMIESQPVSIMEPWSSATLSTFRRDIKLGLSEMTDKGEEDSQNGVCQ